MQKVGIISTKHYKKLICYLEDAKALTIPIATVFALFSFIRSKYMFSLGWNKKRMEVNLFNSY